METLTAADPAGNFFPSFVFLACGTLVAALLGAAHRLGLFYQLMHKVRGHGSAAGWGPPKKEQTPGPSPGPPSSSRILQEEKVRPD